MALPLEFSRQVDRMMSYEQHEVRQNSGAEIPELDEQVRVMGVGKGLFCTEETADVG